MVNAGEFVLWMLQFFYRAFFLLLRREIFVLCYNRSLHLHLVQFYYLSYSSKIGRISVGHPLQFDSS